MVKIKLKFGELKQKSREELEADLKDLRKKLLELRMKGRNSQLKNVKETKELRKNVARILTALALPTNK